MPTGLTIKQFGVKNPLYNVVNCDGTSTATIVLFSMFNFIQRGKRTKECFQTKFELWSRTN